MLNCKWCGQPYQPTPLSRAFYCSQKCIEEERASNQAKKQATHRTSTASSGGGTLGRRGDGKTVKQRQQEELEKAKGELFNMLFGLICIVGVCIAYYFIVMKR